MNPRGMLPRDRWSPVTLDDRGHAQGRLGGGVLVLETAFLFFQLTGDCSFIGDCFSIGACSFITENTVIFIRKFSQVLGSAYRSLT